MAAAQEDMLKFRQFGVDRKERQQQAICKKIGLRTVLYKRQYDNLFSNQSRRNHCYHGKGRPNMKRAYRNDGFYSNDSQQMPVSYPQKKNIIKP